jgi:hypothetical protein
MENTNDRQLSFPQRNWFLLCILVAIFSPLVVHLVQAAAHKESYKESMETRPVNAGGAAPAGVTAAGAQDSSYKMSSPPQDAGKSQDSTKK